MIELLEIFEWLEFLEPALEMGVDVLGSVFGGGSSQKSPRAIEELPPAVERLDLLPGERGTGRCVERVSTAMFAVRRQ